MAGERKRQNDDHPMMAWTKNAWISDSEATTSHY